MPDEKEKNRVTEWSFSFDNIGESVGRLLSSLGVGTEAEVKTGSYSELIGDASAAQVTLDLSVGSVTITDLPDSDNLIEANVTYIGEIEFASKTQDSLKYVRLGQVTKDEVLKPIRASLDAFVRRDELHWDVRLTPNIPLDLRLNSGITNNEFDLSRLQIDTLKFNGGTGKTSIKLPTMGDNYKVTLNSGTGALHVHINDGANINLHANNGTGETIVTVGSGAALEAHITGGIGRCEVNLPAGSAILLKATTGMGKIDVPDSLVRVKGDNDFIATSGTWQTANYETAEHKFT
ncbi:MAG: toast rack family protein, partial [Anaerolineae bacterium]|nr:toast rack family protein [Anaerolineae bacterium]